MVSEILSTGIDNAITGKTICKQLRINHRALTIAIERERREGKPICATCNGTAPGYYLAADKEEMRRYCRSLHRRAGEIFKTRRACMKSLEKLPEAAEDGTV